MYFRNFVIITILLCTFFAQNTAFDCSPCICEPKENAISVSCLNKISTIPDSIINFQYSNQINELNFKGQYFEELNDDISHLYNTKIIIFSHNSIRSINIDFFKNLTNLENLKLDENEISEIQPSLFKYNRKIKYIFLENNKIKYLQKNVFNNLPDLKEIHLNSNQIEIIEDYCFAGVPSLETLDLQDNKLQTLSTKFIDNPENLKLVYLERNPWICDSKLCDLINISLRKNWLWGKIPQCFEYNNSIRSWEDVQILEPVKIRKFDTNTIVCDVETCAEKQIMYWSYNEQVLDNATYCMKGQRHTVTYIFSEFGKEDEGLYTCLIKNCSFCKDESRHLNVADIETNNEKITTTTEDITTTELSVIDETTETTETTTTTPTTTTPKPESNICLECMICAIIALLAGILLGFVIGIFIGLFFYIPLKAACMSSNLASKICGCLVRKMRQDEVVASNNEGTEMLPTSADN